MLNNFKISFLALVTCMLTFAMACNNNKNEAGNSNMISGTGSKTWLADRETTAAGDKDKLDSSEKKERVTFYANGKFTMTSPTNTANGTWTYDAGGKNLALQFDGAGVSENFQVASLSEKEMMLTGGDGSTMELEAE